MIKIRLARYGKRNDPFYRIVAIDSRLKREAKQAEVIGYWHPLKNTKKIHKDKLKAWQEKGAQITKAVEDLL